MRIHFLLLFLWLFFGKAVLICQTNQQLNDTSSINTISPSPVKEKALFSDPKLQYDLKVKVNKSFFQELLQWLSEKFFGKSDYQTQSRVRGLIIWTIVIVSVILIIWLLSKSEMAGLIRKKAKATSFNFTDITEDLTDINFRDKISEALKANDFRLAVRWHYLQILFNLDKNNLIEFAPHKTNIDYRYELTQKKQGDRLKGFSELSRIYEYVWYGQFNINESDYRNYEKDFNDYLKGLSV